MPRFHNIDGRRVPFTPEEEAAADAADAQYSSQEARNTREDERIYKRRLNAYPDIYRQLVAIWAYIDAKGDASGETLAMLNQIKAVNAQFPERTGDV